MTLTIKDLDAGYGKLQILHSLALSVPSGETLALLGRNGAGKTTLLNSLVGLVPNSRGTVVWDGHRLLGKRTERVVSSGVSLVPQSRGLFMGLTVSENLRLACSGLRLSRHEIAKREEEIVEMLPNLRARVRVAAASLSGGEQQMLAIGKALMREPKLLLLDEPSIGLAPRIVNEIAELIGTLRARDRTLIVAEQNYKWLLPLVTRVVFLEEGRIAESLDVENAELTDISELVEARYLGQEISRPSRGGSSVSPLESGVAHD